MWLGLGIALPALIAVIALLLAWRRTFAARVLFLAAGLALVAAVQLDLLHLVPQTAYYTIAG